MTARLRLRRGARTSRPAGVETTQEPAARALLAALPFALMAVVAAVDLLAGSSVGFLPMLSLGPALAAVSLRPAQTGVVGVLAMALCVMLALYDDLISQRRGLIAFATIAGVTAAGLVASAGRQRRERELASVRAVADVAQRVLLRPVPAEVGRVRIATQYISAAAAARIGGDLYEVIATGETVRLIVADVQGKGLPAVQTAAAVLGTFREVAYDAPGLAGIAARIEVSLGRHGGEDEFVTAVLAQVAPDGSAVEILNCGHPPPLLLTPGAARFADPPEAGLPLGLEQIASAPRATHLVPFGPGDRILFYTDGISEARDQSGSFYPVDRCGALFDGLDPEEALERLRLDVIRHVGGALRDDAAMLLIGHPPAAPAAEGGGGDARG